jgi:cytochrome c-type biogenesis protein CcmF
MGYTLRLYHKPLVSWIWAGAGLMAFGGFLAAIGRARRPQRIAELDAPT